MKTPQRILLLGSGGRESAIAWKIKQSPLCEALFIAPGNGGTSDYGTNLDIKPTDFDAVADAIKANNITMVVAGNEDPLVEGLRDNLAPRFPELLIVGPDASGARLEGSKEFAKEFMNEFSIPTARHLAVDKGNLDEGIAFLRSLKGPYVLKADGLAAGKGVLIIDSLEEAEMRLREMLDGMFGAASAKVVIEEFLDGIELSVFVLTDGRGRYVLLPAAKDYKRRGDGDTGLNTGGMGSVGLTSDRTQALLNKIRPAIIEPTLRGLISRGIDYRGIIFFGLIEVEGEPKVIEYNVRLGDPETETVMRLYEGDIVEDFVAAAKGCLTPRDLSQPSQTAATIILVADGYPGSYRKGDVIALPASLAADVIVFHAGTKRLPDGTLTTSGGRVLAVSATSPTLQEALDKAAGEADHIAFEGKSRRSDIGRDVLTTGRL